MESSQLSKSEVKAMFGLVAVAGKLFFTTVAHEALKCGSVRGEVGFIDRISRH